MAPNMSKLARYGALAGGLSVVLSLYYKSRAKKAREQREVDPVAASIHAANAKKDRVAVDAEFFRRLWRLLKIIVPGPLSPEAGYIGLVCFSMVARTYCDLWMIRISTAIERTIISRDNAGFRKGLAQFFASMVPIAVITNLLKYGLNELGLRFRTRLTRHLYEQYLKGFTYYKINNLDNRISNPDQLLTQDVEKFCNSIAELFSNISKPILDIVIYARKLTGAIGGQGPATMMIYLAMSGLVLTRLRRPTGRYTVQEQRLEGEFRFVNSRLITNSEEIAFYNGNERERLVINQSFARLVRLLRTAMQFRFTMGCVDSIIAKYFATVVGFYVVSRPFLNLGDKRHSNMAHNEIMEDYYRSGRMLINLATATGRLVLAGRELTRLAGFTARVTDLMDVLRDLNSGKYVRTMVSNEGEGSADRAGLNLAPNNGRIIEQDNIIRFDKVPLVTPNGDLLVRALSFEVQSGCNVLVCGPNGCGKSSLFRHLGELWPLFGGVLTKPAKEKLFYVPQRPYMTLGTLRDQITYPHSDDERRKRGVADDELKEYLEQVHLGYLVEREGGLDSVQDWMDVLSGGEKQRVAMARLFYHRPQFAILDECTSAVSVDVEGFMYARCREVGITLFTVSHRKSLWKYHDYALQFDGRGQYEFKRIDASNADDQFGS